MVQGRPDLHAAILGVVDAGIVALDREARILEWNSWMESASGHPGAEVLGKTLWTVFPEAAGGPLAGAIAFVLDSGASRLLTHALHPRLLPLKTRARRELLHDVTLAPVKVETSIVCVMHVSDVTTATRRELFLRQRQNARYDAVVESAQDAILTLDSAGVISLANTAAARQFGCPAKDLVGRDAATLFVSRDAWAERWSGVMDGSVFAWPVELVGRRSDGSHTHLEASLSRWQSDSRLFSTAILRDVNERHEAEAQARSAARALADLNATLEQRVQERTAQLMLAEEALRQSQKMEAIGQLTGGIAHDFNNHLQGIVGSIQIAQYRVAAGRLDEVGPYLKAARDSAGRAGELTHRLLAFSRRQPIDPRPADLNALIDSVEDLLQRALGHKLEMHIVRAPGLWLVRCDASQLENALLNLAINARDAMPKGGRLTVETRNLTLDPAQALLRDVPPGEYVCITATDTGSGMPPEVQTRAFDPFYTTKPMGQGTGLGLSMIYGFARQSGGSARIESEVGRGTSVEICLPRFVGELVPSRPVQQAVTPIERRSDDTVVLVVEDEDVVRSLVVKALAGLGYQTIEAPDAETALPILLSGRKIDLLATDIGLPDMNGSRIADAARAARPGLKVLFMTGYSEDAAGNAFLGADMELLRKPFTLEALGAKVQAMLGSRS